MPIDSFHISNKPVAYWFKCENKSEEETLSKKNHDDINKEMPFYQTFSKQESLLRRGGD